MNRLAKVVSAFIDALLWSECDENSEPFDENYSARDLSADTVATICADCAEFLRLCDAANLSDFDTLALRHNNSASIVNVGYDFCLTRNEHGAGFWDGDWDKGDELTAIAQTFPPISLYLGDDGAVYHCAG